VAAGYRMSFISFEATARSALEALLRGERRSFLGPVGGRGVAGALSDIMGRRASPHLRITGSAYSQAIGPRNGTTPLAARVTPLARFPKKYRKIHRWLLKLQITVASTRTAAIQGLK